MRLILISGKKGSGKNTVADMIRDALGYRNVKNEAFARPLKELCSQSFKPFIEELNGIFGGMRWAEGVERPQFLGSLITKHDNWFENKNFLTRHLLQIVGTEIVRTVDPLYWIKQTIINLGKLDTPVATVSDWRFPDEHTEVENIYSDCTTLQVLRSNQKDPTDNHISENALQDYKMMDFVIDNSGSLNVLRQSVNDFLNWWEGRPRSRPSGVEVVS